MVVTVRAGGGTVHVLRIHLFPDELRDGVLILHLALQYPALQRKRLFINTSESEGIPVSIMEALSFGIPVIAPDIGGISEIITSGLNGILIDRKDNVVLYAEAMLLITDMDVNDYLSLRRNARKSWEDKWNSFHNYNNFATWMGEV